MTVLQMIILTGCGCVDDRICVVIILLTVLASKVTLFDPPEPRFNGTGLFLTKCVKFERNASEIPETLLQICSSTEIVVSNANHWSIERKSKK